MGEIRQAIVTEDKAIICPYCYKKNGQLSGNETIKNFKMRCRGSNGRTKHYFMLDVDTEVKLND